MDQKKKLLYRSLVEQNTDKSKEGEILLLSSRKVSGQIIETINPDSETISPFSLSVLKQLNYGLLQTSMVVNSNRLHLNLLTPTAAGAEGSIFTISNI